MSTLGGESLIDEWLAPRNDREAQTAGSLMVFLGITILLLASWSDVFSRGKIGLYPAPEHPDNNVVLCIVVPALLSLTMWWGRRGSPRRLSLVVLGISLFAYLATLSFSTAGQDATLVGFSMYLMPTLVVAYIWRTRVTVIMATVANMCLLVQMTFVYKPQEALTNWIACMLVITGTCLALAWSRDYFERHSAVLRRAATTDDLTGLATRIQVDDLMSDHETGSDVSQVALMICDSDYFKAVNDEHGHLAGDEALRKVGSLIKVLVTNDDVAYRLGGDELAVYMPGKSRQEALATAERIVSTVAAVPVPLPASREFGISITAGLAHTSDVSKVKGLYADADKALYTGKVSARGAVTVASQLNDPHRDNRGETDLSSPAEDAQDAEQPDGVT